MSRETTTPDVPLFFGHRFMKAHYRLGLVCRAILQLTQAIIDI